MRIITFSHSPIHRVSKSNGRGGDFESGRGGVRKGVSNLGQRIKHFWELDVYKLAFKSAKELYEISKSFPKEESYSLTDQIRRSSRSVCGNISEAWHKRRYKAAFVSKLNDSEAEAGETQNWLFFAKACKYISNEVAEKLHEDYNNIIGKLVIMIKNPDHWTI